MHCTSRIFVFYAKQYINLTWPYWGCLPVPSQLNLPKNFLNGVYINNKIYFFPVYVKVLSIHNVSSLNQLYSFLGIFPSYTFILFVAFCLLFMLFISQAFKNRYLLRQHFLLHTQKEQKEPYCKYVF